MITRASFYSFIFHLLPADKEIDSTNTPGHLGHGMFAELDALLNGMETELLRKT